MTDCFCGLQNTFLVDLSDGKLQYGNTCGNTFHDLLVQTCEAFEGQSVFIEGCAGTPTEGPTEEGLYVLLVKHRLKLLN